MSDEPKKSKKPSEAPLHGLLAEYNLPHEMVHAAKKIRDAGFTKWDTYSPFPVHGIDDAMGIKMTCLLYTSPSPRD